MKSLSDAGLTSNHRFVKAVDIDTRPFEIVRAWVNPNGYNGQREIVYHLRILDDAANGPLFYDDEGNPVGPDVSWSASPTPSRERHAEYFEDRRAESLGPCEFQFIPTRSGSPFANIVDAADYVVPDELPMVTVAAPAPQNYGRANLTGQLSAPSSTPAAGLTGEAAREQAAANVASRRGRRAAPALDDSLEDLPF